MSRDKRVTAGLLSSFQTSSAIHERYICVGVVLVLERATLLYGLKRRAFDRRLLMLPSAHGGWEFFSSFAKLCVFGLNTNWDLDHLYICKRLALDPRNENEMDVLSTSGTFHINGPDGEPESGGKKGF